MISRFVCVSCDRCGTPCGGVDALSDNAAQARRVAKARGWKRLPLDAGLRHEDVCPNCLPVERAAR